MDSRLRRALAGSAEYEQRRYTGRQLRVRSSRRVHAVALTTWLAGLKAPAPLCHVGVSGWDLSAMSPTDEPVSCARCQRKIAAGDKTTQPTNQITIFDALSQAS